jgi:hypothetical protein
VNNYTHNFEISDLLRLFVSAFDDTFVFRHDEHKNRKSKIAVKYIFGPKQRVMHDIINAEKHITLPVVSIEQTNVSRDATRVFNKDQFFYRANYVADEIVSHAKIPTPIPVTMDISVTMIAKYKSDIDQIVSNFLPYANPYFMVSWNTPKEFGTVFRDEINSKVHWDGSVSFDNPTDLPATDKFRITATTTFKIEGWIFPAHEEVSAPIYKVHTDFTNVDLITDFDEMDVEGGYNEALSLSGETEFVEVSAAPSMTNAFYALNNNRSTAVVDDISLNFNEDVYINMVGKRFDYTNTWFLSGDITTSLPLTSVDTIQSGVLSGYKLDTVEVVNDNIAILDILSDVVSSGTFKIITRNDVGWAAFDYTFTVD